MINDLFDIVLRGQKDNDPYSDLWPDSVNHTNAMNASPNTSVTFSEGQAVDLIMLL